MQARSKYLARVSTRGFVGMLGLLLAAATG